MTNIWILGTFYTISTIAVIILMVRYFRRRRALQNDGRQAESVVVQEIQPEEKLQDTAVPSPSVEDRKYRESAGQNISWENHQLFSQTDRSRLGQGQSLEKIGSADVPLLDPDGSVFGPITASLATLLPESAERREQTKRELLNAGYYKPQSMQNLEAIRYLCIMVPLLFVGALLVLLPVRFEVPLVVLLVVLPLLGWALPRLYVKNHAADRKHQIEQAMPDLLDLLNMCVSQGLTVTDSLKTISHDFETVYPALSQELKIVSEQSDIGTFQQALENLSHRVDVPEVHSFTSLLIQTERMGTSVSEALLEYSDSIRESLRQRADEKANQAAFKLLFPTVLCLMPAVYMFLLGPATMELSNFFTDGGSEVLDSGRDALDQLNNGQ